MEFPCYDDKALEDQLSGNRFSVTYLLRGDEAAALERAKALCVEQTVEFPVEIIDCPAIRERLVGKIESMTFVGGRMARTVISYADETAGEELPQLLNVIYGNSSILPGVTLERIKLSAAQKAYFPGPRFGVAGLRKRLGVSDRPLACTTLKPMGLPPESLADEAYQFALGGIDIIKDDHGLMDQSFARFRRRVELVTAAVRKANAETGGHTIYVPNLSGGFRDMLSRIGLAEDCGAGGLMFAPGLVGFDMLHYTARHASLPVVCHPAFLGANLDRGKGGIDCACLMGQLPRIAGADMTIFPGYGGRFSLTKEQCRGIRDAVSEKMRSIRPIFPCVAGGMTVSRVKEMVAFYGNDTALLIGGGLFTEPGTLTENCKNFVKELEKRKGG